MFVKLNSVYLNLDKTFDEFLLYIFKPCYLRLKTSAIIFNVFKFTTKVCFFYFFLINLFSGGKKSLNKDKVRHLIDDKM